MSDRFVVILDAGSSKIRCYVFDHRGQQVLQGSRDWQYIDPVSIPNFAQELDINRVWSSIIDLISECVGNDSVPVHDVAAVAVTGQRQGIVFIDDAEREIYAGPNTDLRAVFEGGAIDEEYSDLVYQTTGKLPSFLFSMAKLQWFKNHQPDKYVQIKSVITLPDWLRLKLSGELSSEYTLAAEAGLLDIRKRDWCTELSTKLDLPVNTDVPLTTAGTISGYLSRKVSKQTNLPQGTPVVVTGADTQTALLGLGINPGAQLGIIAGWSIPIMTVTDRPILDINKRTWTGCYLDENQWTLESTCGDAGNAYDYFSNLLWPHVSDPFSMMDKSASNSPIGSEGGLAFLGPTKMDMSRVGMQSGGFIFPVPITFGGIDRQHLTRSVLEGISYSVRSNIDQLEDIYGYPVKRIAVGGGMAKTKQWIEILTNVIGRSIEIDISNNPTANGAYLTAVTALGDFNSLTDKSNHEIFDMETIEPDQSQIAQYYDLYQQWSELGLQLRSIRI